MSDLILARICHSLSPFCNVTGHIAGALYELSDLWGKVHHISVDRRPFQACMTGIKQCLVNGLNFGHADPTVQRDEFLIRNDLMQCAPQSRICVAATQRCEAQLGGVDCREQSTRRCHQPFVELKDVVAAPNLLYRLGWPDWRRSQQQQCCSRDCEHLWDRSRNHLCSVSVRRPHLV